MPISQPIRDMLVPLGDDTYFWLSQYGGPLSYWGIRNAFRRVFQQAGLQGPKLGPHILRHTFATEYCRSGGNIRALQTIMGHERLATTMIYVHLAGQDVRADHAAHSPVQTLGLKGL